MAALGRAGSLFRKLVKKCIFYWPFFFVDCVSRSNVCVSLVVFVDGFMMFRNVSISDVISTGRRAMKSAK